MPTNILMPALSPTMEKGNLAKWLKKEGDQVKSGDVIAEIETDKATMDVEAVDEGTLAKIVVPEGAQDVPVNSVIAVLTGEGEDAKTVKAPAPAGQPKAEAKPIEPKPAAALAPTNQAEPVPAKPPTPAPVPSAPKGAEPKTNGRGGRIFASPLARRIAKESGIELSTLQGSGPHGRIVARDVAQAKSVRVAPSAPGAAPPGGLMARGMTDEQIRKFYEEGSYEFVPHDGMRKTIARRLVESKLTIPHYYLTTDCELDTLLKAREEINAGAPEAGGKPRWKLSVNDFVIKALALALIKVPNANVTWTEAGMLRHKHADVGVAVALDGGLITPVIRGAETKPLSAISNEMKDFAARARARKLKPEEYLGGTTAVSNLGMYGINHFTAVINPPHATILAVGTSEERPVVRSGKIEIAHMMSVTLSCDHRAIDGALGAELIGAFKMLIENPVMMMV